VADHDLTAVDLESTTSITSPTLFPWKNVVKPLRGNGVPTAEDVEIGEFAISLDTGEMWTQNEQHEVVRLGGLYWSAETQRPTTRSAGGGFTHINDGKDGTSLPTSDPEIDGAFWNDNGVLKVSDG